MAKDAGQSVECGRAGLYARFSRRATRRALRARGIAFTSPEKKDHAANRVRKGSAGGRPPVFYVEVYKGRTVVERCFNRLKQFRALATRYTKRAAYYRTELTLAAIVLWLRDFTGHGLGRPLAR